MSHLNVYRFASEKLKGIEHSINPAVREQAWNALTAMYAEPWRPGGTPLPPWQNGVVSCESALADAMSWLNKARPEPRARPTP